MSNISDVTQDSKQRHIRTDGIVLKESPLGENGKLLVIFSKDYGRIAVAAKGVKKPGSSLVQLSQLFSYSNLELYRGNSSMYTLTGGTLIESFFGLCEDYDRLQEAGKMARMLLKVIQDDLPDEETLKLFLNSLYFISTGKRKPDFVRCMFILKLLQYQGVSPEPEEIELMWHKPIKNGTMRALEHIYFSEAKELFSFSVSSEVFSELEGISSMLLNDILN